MGRLFATGELSVERVISLAGPAQPRPRLLRTRLGASIPDLLVDDPIDGDHRVVSGSLLSGRSLGGQLAVFSAGTTVRSVCCGRVTTVSCSAG